MRSCLRISLRRASGGLSSKRARGAWEMRAQVSVGPPGASVTSLRNTQGCHPGLFSCAPLRELLKRVCVPQEMMSGNRSTRIIGHDERNDEKPIEGQNWTRITGMKLGLIAGNGRFPFLLLDAARAQGLAVCVAAIREETDPEINHRAAMDEKITVHWLSLGELSRLIEVFHKEDVKAAVMAGQVKHKQIFSSIRPDWRLAKLLLNLRTRNTDMLLGAVAKVLADEGIELMSSTQFLEPLLAEEGSLTEAAGGRGPTEDERKNIEYGLGVARALAGFDIGQTVVVAAQACVAVEAMEGTDATIERAALLMKSMEEDGAPASTLQRDLTVVKVAKPNQDMRFDVPVIGIKTIETMIAAGASCLSVEAGRTLLFDRDALLKRAAEAGIAVAGTPRLGPRDPGTQGR
jgi:UDP-2,3-diacylglucosamine hydrolase